MVILPIRCFAKLRFVGLSSRSSPSKSIILPYFDFTLHVGSQRFGLSHDLVIEQAEPYLERWIFWCGFSIRIHKFHKGDDDRAFHDHPWWFVTIPIKSYLELTPNQEAQTIKAGRPHYRKATHQHIVQLKDEKPTWTLIITGLKQREWGFWSGTRFTEAEEWMSQSAKTCGRYDS